MLSDADFRRKVTTSYDSGGRPALLVGQVGTGQPGNYVNAVSYGAQGAIQSITLGNSVVVNTTYNSRLQPTQIQAGSLLTLTNRFDPSAGNDVNCSAASTTVSGNNGNVLAQTVNGTGRIYSYDGANRLCYGAQGSTWTQSYSYDARGNLGTSGTGQVPAPTAESIGSTGAYGTNNQVSSWAYDAAGNVTGIQATGGSMVRATCATNTMPGTAMLRTACYDAEDRMVSETDASGSTTTYTYDGDGHRVNKSASGVNTTYVYDPMGQLAQEYGGPSVPALEAGTHYLTTDHLGSTRLVTKADGTADATYDYLPFGQEFVPGADPNRIRFTSKERDAETGLDYFGARYFSSAQGRFTSVDPIWVTGERLLDPQRLNLYAYGRNNPLRFIDPDGMDITLGKCDAGTTQQCYNQVLAGLQKDDRSHVQLVQGDGKNGFKKGEYGITVDQDYKSDSKNFQTLQKLAGDHSATARIDVLSPNDKFDVRMETTFNRNGAPSPLSTMSMTPGNPNDPNSNSFVGYTFFPPGTGAPSPYSIGNFTDVVVNTISPDGISSTIHHELRHVLLGDFGRVAPYGTHGTGKVDRETTEAEKEAVKNSKVK